MDTTEQSSPRRRPDRRYAWAGLVLLACLAYGLRSPLTDLVERWRGLESLTPFAIRVLSTLPERGLLFLVTASLLGPGAMMAARSALGAQAVRRRRGVYLLLALLFFLALFYLGAGVLRFSHLAASLLLVAMLAIGTATVRAAGRRDRAVSESAVACALVGCAVSAVAVLLPHESGLLQIRARVRPDPSVERFAQGDFNWIELSLDRSTLYVAGHGVARLRAYDTLAPDRPPKEAAVGTGGAQSFGYDPESNELYLFNPATESLHVLDGSTLAVRRSHPVPGVATGDSWVVWHAASRLVFIVSEADIEKGSAFVVVDGPTGEIVERSSWAAGNLLLDPRRPVMYLSFFRRGRELLAYDVERREIVQRAVADRRSDRMAFSEKDDELLVASPLRSAVQRFDARTLERKSDLEAVFGVRSLAVDAVRGLLACASLATTAVAFVDLDNGEVVSRHSVAPWLRTVRLDPVAGVAYVSSKYGLFKLDYAENPPQG